MNTTCLINNCNYAQFVCEAVEGALRQTVSFDEIIVVDDGSTDGSLELLHSTYGRHPAVQIVGKSNQGQLSCLNEGFARSAGRIIFFLDADDVYEPTYLQQALDVHNRVPDCDFLFCGRPLFGQQEGLDLLFREDRDMGYSVIRTALTHNWIGAPTSCLSIRRHILEKILPLPFVDEWRVRADDCLVFGASLAGARKRYLAQPLVNYRVHANNHLHGSKPDRAAVFRRRLAMNRLFEYLQRELHCNVARLSEFAHREFRTIDRPTMNELANYCRVCLGAPVSWTRRTSCMADMFLHFITARGRGATSSEAASPRSSDEPESYTIPFPQNNEGAVNHGEAEAFNKRSLRAA